MYERPIKFRRLLGWANVEADAEPLRQKFIAEEARRQAAHDEYAEPDSAIS